MAVEAEKLQGLAHAVFLSRIGAQSPNQPEVRLGQGAFLTLRLVDLLAPDLPRVQQDVFHYQWSATERYCKELLNEGTEGSHLHGIVQATSEAYHLSDIKLLVPELFAYVYFLENELRLEEALDVIETMIRVGDRKLSQEDALAAQLRLGLLNRNLARFDLAQSAYTEAERLAEKLGDRRSALLGRVGRVIALMRRGNLAESEEQLLTILAEAKTTGLQDIEARAEHVMGEVLVKRGVASEGAPHLWRAFELYEDREAQLRALGDLGYTLLRLGDVDGGERALHEVLRRGGQRDTILNATIELMHCASFRRNRVGFERWRTAFENQATSAPPNILADFHLKAGIGYGRFGLFPKADQLLEQALGIAKANRLHEFEFRIERIKAGLGDCEEVARVGLQATAEPVLQTEALREVSNSLALLGA